MQTGRAVVSRDLELSTKAGMKPKKSRKNWERFDLLGELHPKTCGKHIFPSCYQWLFGDSPRSHGHGRSGVPAGDMKSSRTTNTGLGWSLASLSRLPSTFIRVSSFQGLEGLGFPSSHSSHGTLFSHRETAGLPFLGWNAFGAKVDCFGQQVNGHLARTGLEISSAP